MASYKILCVAACLIACIVYANGMPGGHGHAESYLESNLEFGGHGISLGHGGSEGLGGGSEGLGGGEYKHKEIEVHHHPKYAYKYGVEDKHTGDYKDAKEERDGDIVHGEYSLLQPDGRKRIVHYTASKHGGFQAHVSYSGHAIHPEIQHHKLPEYEHKLPEQHHKLY